MRSYGHFGEPVWDLFPDTAPQRERELVDARKARDNAPIRVFGEMAQVVGTSLAVVALIDVAVLLISGPMKMFHIG
jgi:hypothetical protein